MNCASFLLSRNVMYGVIEKAWFPQYNADHAAISLGADVVYIPASITIEIA